MLKTETGEATPQSCLPYIPNKEFGIIIIAPEPNSGLLFTTMASIKREYHPKVPNVICVTVSSAKTAIVDSMAKMCPVFLGGDSITSLINTGMQQAKDGWNIIVMAGVQLRSESTSKLMGFATDESYIVYPIVVDYDRRGRPMKIYSDFDESTLNGMTMHKSTFEKIGNFSNNPIQVSKMFWAMDAWEKGCSFRSVLGAKII